MTTDSRIEEIESSGDEDEILPIGLEQPNTSIPIQTDDDPVMDIIKVVDREECWLERNC